MRSIRKLLIATDSFLRQQIRVGTAETGRTELIMDIHHQMVFRSQPHKVVQPSSPTMAGILYKTGLHTHNTPLTQYRK